MTTLSDLKTGLEGAVSGGRLTLTRDLVGVEEIAAFLDTLPSARLTLEVAEPGGISLSGSAYPQSLTVVGPGTERWAVRGLGDEALGLSRVTVTFTQEAADAPLAGRLDLLAGLTVAGKPLALEGRLLPDNSLRLNLASGNDSLFSLTEVVEYATQGTESPTLASLVPLFQGLKFAAFDLGFGFAAEAPTSLRAALAAPDPEAGWDFIPGFSIRGVGAEVTGGRTFTPEVENSLLAFGGHVMGRLVIGSEFDVVLGIESGDFWELAVYPLGGNVVPGLYELADLAGGESLQNEVRRGFELLGLDAFSVTEVNIGFRLSPPGVTYVEMRGRMQLGAVGVDVRAQIPNFRFGAKLSPDSRISLKALVAQYFAGAEEMPEIDITALGMNAYPSAGEYDFAVEVEDDWEFDTGLGVFALRQVELEVRKGAGGFGGSITTTLTLADLPVVVSAASPTGDGGWSFEGRAEPDAGYSIGGLVSEIAAKFGVRLPEFVNDIMLERLTVLFDTRTKDFKFTCEGLFPVADACADITLDIEINNLNRAGQGGAPAYEKKLSGVLKLRLDEDPAHDLTFKLALDKDDVNTSFAASYAGAEKVNIKDLVTLLSAEVGDLVPQSLELGLKDAFFVISRQAAAAQGQPATNRFLFGLDISASISLSDLPLVGSKFPPEQTAGVQDLQFVIASLPFTQAEVGGFGPLLAEGVTPLPPRALDKGLAVSAIMQWGGQPEVLTLPVVSGGAGGQAALPPPAPATTAGGTSRAAGAADNARWFALQKAFGPVYFEKVGVQYRDAAVWFLLNASLSVAGLTLSLDGLAVGSTLNDFDPRFDLRGLGIDYKAGTVEVGGAFLRIPKEQSGKSYDEYDGAAIVRAGQLALSAIGSYAELGGQPSLFVYAVLDYPLGGPSFFFITGLAAGFGYNRSLVVPPVERVAQFPLVADAVSGAAMPKDLGPKLAAIQQSVPPAVGEYFLAVGIKFTSFKLVDSFALLTVSFGTQFEVNLLGLSTLIVPTPIPGQTVTPLAEVQMALRATYNPSQGFLGVSAQLTSASFILSRNCHLTGGFAFYTWFGGEHEGDFVLTLGGYHPDYVVPAHYPQVPRVGFNWRVDSKLSLKGGSYYALTAAALMAGGSLQATWDDGDLKAHFNASADFIIYWQPYHYDAKISVDIGVSYTYNLFGTHHLNVDVGADLHIWGPEFAGTARVKLSIISFDISFGSGSARQLKPIGWDAFQESFLPKDKNGQLAICGVSISGGMLGAPGAAGVDWVVNPKTLALVTDSVIPSKVARARGGAVPGLGAVASGFGIGPMDVPAADFSSAVNVTLGKHNELTGEYEPAETDFAFGPVLKNVPVALWGTTLTPPVNGPAFVRDTLAGFVVTPAAAPPPGVTADIDRAALLYDADDVPAAFAWGEFPRFVPQDFGADEGAADRQRRAAVGESINAEATAAGRARLLGALGVTAAVRLDDFDAAGEAFLIAPQVAAPAA